MARKYRRIKKRRRNSDSSWKKLKKRFQLKKRAKKLGLVFLVFCSALITLGIVYAWHYLNQPFASASGELEATSSWNSKYPLNILWLETETDKGSAALADIAVLSLNTTSDRLAVLTVPVDHEIGLPSQPSQQLQTTFRTGDSLEDKQGVELTAKRVSYLLGLPINGYLLISSEGIKKMTQDLSGDSLESFFSIKNITRLPNALFVARKYLKTNLSLGEVARVIYFLLRVRSDRIKSVDFDSQTLADTSAVDRVVAPLLRDENLVAERLKIQVLNGTTKPGLASLVARMARNMGADVIRVDNYERQDLTRGFLILGESGTYTAQRLAYAIGVVDGRQPKTSVEKRADITIVLGLEDYERIF